MEIQRPWPSVMQLLSGSRGRIGVTEGEPGAGVTATGGEEPIPLSIRSAIAQIVVPLISAKPLQRPERIMFKQLPTPSWTHARTMLGVTGRPSNVPMDASSLGA